MGRIGWLRAAVLGASASGGAPLLFDILFSDIH
jgi:hypothetical protein